MASLSEAPLSIIGLEDAYRYCSQLAKSHYENFTLGSWFLPRRLRPHLFAIYAFCRHTDDLGDESTGNRLELLEDWECELFRCYEQKATHPIMVALQHTIKQFTIQPLPFLKLIEANRMDQSTNYYRTYQDLLYYCEHSANPVGHLVLSILGQDSPDALELSDSTCTALQLTNFWQDVRRDWKMDRLYIPLEDMERFGCSEDDLNQDQASAMFRSLMQFEVDRTERLFQEGFPLVHGFKGFARFHLSLFSEGGLAVLKMIRNQQYDVLNKRPTISTPHKVRLMVATVSRLAFKRCGA